MTHSPLADRLATVVYRLGLAGADDEELRVRLDREVTVHFEARGTPAWIVALFDDILAGRRTDAPVPCPAGYLDGEDALRCVLAYQETDAALRLDLGDDHWTWVLPRLNLVLRVRTGPTAEYTLTNWVAAYPRLTVGLATILHRLGLADAADDDLRADVHEAVTDHLLDNEPPAWLTHLVDSILHRRYSPRRVTIPAGYPGGGSVLRNILADLAERFALTIEDEGEWWEWTMAPLDIQLWVSREVSYDRNQYLLRRPPSGSGHAQVPQKVR